MQTKTRSDTSFLAVTNNTRFLGYLIMAGPRLSKIPAADPDWAWCFDKLESLEHQPADWTPECGVLPTCEVIVGVRAMLEMLRQRRMVPSRLSPSVIGGIGITFTRGDRKAYVEFNNKGSVHVLYSDGVTDPKVDKILSNEIGYSGLIEGIKSYLHE